jgi:inositol-phosphate phosphatase/L-galactose 1-phosphate phosphatase/histidinol-phosphatase
MSLDNITLTAHHAADQAGEILRKYFGQNFHTETKTDNSPVTQADREVEQAIRGIIGAAFPNHGIIGEEYGAENPDAEYQWVIDPIDGTKAFIAGKTTFTTLIALCKNGEPILGVIDQPIIKKRWFAETSQSPAVSCQSPEAFTLATTSMEYFTPAQKEAYERVNKMAADITLGGDAYAYAMLSEGKLDVVIDAGMKIYDYMALVPVVTATGGIITDWRGNALTLASQGDVLACIDKQLHAKIIGIL